MSALVFATIDAVQPAVAIGGSIVFLFRAGRSCFLDRIRPRISESLNRSFLGDGNALYDVADVGRVLLRVAPGETGDDVHAADDLAENRVVTH